MQTELNSRTWAEIDLSALLHNLLYAKKCVPNTPVMCVVKANAYGHGAEACGLFLEQNGADAFAVACLDEAVSLREAGVKRPILILGYTSPEYARMLAGYGLTQTLVDLSHAEEMNFAAHECGVRVRAHIKLDTGMGRSGIIAYKGYVNHAIVQACKAFELPNLNITGIYSHMSVADTPSQRDYTLAQIECFNSVCEGIKTRGHEIKCRHISNSAGIMTYPEARFDMVREGISLYGMYPDSQPTDGPLRPVMTLKSRITLIKDIPQGSSISYGRTYTTEECIKSAVIAAGYADGFPRRASNQCHLVINNQNVPQIGTVCMDMMMANITGIDAKRGDEVMLFGGQGAMTTEELSQIVGTINYELTSLVSPRVRRVYINDNH